MGRFLVVWIMIVILVIVYRLYERFYGTFSGKFERWRRLRRIKKDAKKIFVRGIWEYRKKCGTLVGSDESFLRFFDKAGFQGEAVQSMADQVLKMYAEELFRAHEMEEKRRDEYRAMEKHSNRLSRKEIEEIIKENDDILKNKREKEAVFWEMHDAVKSLGLETFGQWSYKIYLMLKPEALGLGP